MNYSKALKALKARGLQALRPFTTYQGQRKRLGRRFNWAQSVEERLASAQAELQDAHRQYVTGVSIPAAAISLQLAAVVLEICRATRPSSVLDVGSGFSSFVLRTYQRRDDPACQVVSVDTDHVWLEATRRFLERSHLGAGGLLTWEQMQAAPPRQFGLILHDVGGDMAFRLQALEQVAGWCSASTILLLDDAHKPHYRKPLRAWLAGRGAEEYSLEWLTRDDFGRFAFLATAINSDRSQHDR